MKELDFSVMNETTAGVFHTKAWGQALPEDLLNQLLAISRINPNRKARLCLHPSPDELLQVTYLAFCNPYSDRIHSHPHREEVLVPIMGQAKFTTFDASAKPMSTNVLDGRIPTAISTSKGVWHAIEILSPSFVMIEIGTGPFLKDSTIFL